MRETPSIVVYGSVCEKLKTLRVAAGIDLGGDAVAGAHEVAVHEAAVQDERLRLGVADAAAELARRPSSILKSTSTRSGAPGTGVVSTSTFSMNGRRWMRCLERSTAVFERYAAFELAHLAAQHLVVDAGRAAESDVAHVHAIARIDEERERDSLVSWFGVGTGSTFANA